MRVPARIVRVITLAPNLTEIVYAIGSGDKIAGTDDFSDEPDAAKRLPKVGGMQPNVEKITTLRPDLVIATTNGNHPNLSPALANVGIALFVVRTDHIDEIARAMDTLGTLLGSPRRHEAVSALRAAIARERRTRPHPPRVLFAVWADPLYVAGRDTFGDDLIRLCGGVNAVEVKGWPQYSLESLLASPPDLVVYPSRSVSRGQVEKLFANAPAPPAIVPVDENRFTRPGPRVAIAAGELNAIMDAWESRIH